MQAFSRAPGYTGFLPEAEANEQARRHATDHTATDGKDCRLLTLQQLKLNIPGTAIFQPRDAANLMAPPKGRVGTATHFNVRRRARPVRRWARGATPSHPRLPRSLRTRHLRLLASARCMSHDTLSWLSHLEPLETFGAAIRSVAFAACDG